MAASVACFPSSRCSRASTGHRRRVRPQGRGRLALAHGNDRGMAGTNPRVVTTSLQTAWPPRKSPTFAGCGQQGQCQRSLNSLRPTPRNRVQRQGCTTTIIRALPPEVSTRGSAEPTTLIIPRPNGCCHDCTRNPGAATQNEICSIRTNMQGRGDGQVVGTGERFASLNLA